MNVENIHYSSYQESGTEKSQTEFQMPNLTISICKRRLYRMGAECAAEVHNTSFGYEHYYINAQSIFKLCIFKDTIYSGGQCPWKAQCICE